MASLTLPLSKSGQRWLNERRDMFEVFYIIPVLEAASALARARGGRSITGTDLDAAEAEDDLPLPPPIPKEDGKA